MPDTGVNRSQEFGELKQLFVLLREDLKEARRENAEAWSEIRREMATKAEVRSYAEETNRRFTEVQSDVAKVDIDRVAGEKDLHSRVNKVRDDMSKRIDDMEKTAREQQAELHKTKSQRTFQIVTIVITASLGTISTIISAIVVATTLGGGG